MRQQSRKGKKKGPQPAEQIFPLLFSFGMLFKFVLISTNAIISSVIRSESRGERKHERNNRAVKKINS